MKDFSTAIFSIFFAIFSILPNSAFAQTKTPEGSIPTAGATSQVPFDITSSWRITVNRVAGVQVPQIPDGAKGNGDTKKFLLNAISVFTKGEIVKMNAELIETAQVRMLILTPATGNKMITIQGQDGNFEGTLTNPAGIVLGVKIQKLSENELSGIQPDKEPLINKVSADVPNSCANFIGGWAGDWESGQRYLWVTEIDAKCTAKYLYSLQQKKAKGTQPTEIKDGVLTVPCGTLDGVCRFTYHGDKLWANYIGSDGSNHTVFKKITTVK